MSDRPRCRVCKRRIGNRAKAWLNDRTGEIAHNYCLYRKKIISRNTYHAAAYSVNNNWKIDKELA